MTHTHYIEQFRQNNKTLIVNSPLQPINKLEAGLKLTKNYNCKTIAVWKIKLKPGVTITHD